MKMLGKNCSKCKRFKIGKAHRKKPEDYSSKWLRGMNTTPNAAPYEKAIRNQKKTRQSQTNILVFET